MYREDIMITVLLRLQVINVNLMVKNQTEIYRISYFYKERIENVAIKEN